MLIDDLLMLLATMGATKIEKAISINQLKLLPDHKDRAVDEEIANLQSADYVILVDDKVYLTQKGVLRAFSRFS
jgi:hypothetical protein